MVPIFFTQHKWWGISWRVGNFYGGSLRHKMKRYKMRLKLLKIPFFFWQKCGTLSERSEEGKWHKNKSETVSDTQQIAKLEVQQGN